MSCRSWEFKRAVLDPPQGTALEIALGLASPTKGVCSRGYVHVSMLPFGWAQRTQKGSLRSPRRS